MINININFEKETCESIALLCKFLNDYIDLENCTDRNADPSVEFLTPENFFSKAENENAAPDDLVNLRAKFNWDSRIHSRTKTKNRDGSWRYAKNVNPELINVVEKELAQSLSQPSAPAIDNNLGKELQTDLTNLYNTDTPSAPAAEIKPVAIPVPEVDPFDALMVLIKQRIAENTLTAVKVIDLVKTFGVSNLPELANKPELIPFVKNAIEGLSRA